MAIQDHLWRPLQFSERPHIGKQVPSGNFAPNLMLKKCGFKQPIQGQKGDNPACHSWLTPTYVADMLNVRLCFLSSCTSNNGQQLFCIKKSPRLCDLEFGGVANQAEFLVRCFCRERDSLLGAGLIAFIPDIL